MVTKTSNCRRVTWIEDLFKLAPDIPSSLRRLVRCRLSRLCRKRSKPCSSGNPSDEEKASFPLAGRSFAAAAQEVVADPSRKLPN